MLVEITVTEAFEMLLDKEQRKKVYLKTLGSHHYLVAHEQRWCFGKSKYSESNTKDFNSAEFFKEIETKK